MSFEAKRTPSWPAPVSRRSTRFISRSISFWFSSFPALTIASSSTSLTSASIWLRAISMRFTASAASFRSPRSSKSIRICASMSASVPPECGSLRTTRGRVCSFPPTDSFTV